MGGFSKKKSKVLTTFFLFRLNLFSELSQSNIKTLFQPKCLKKKQAKKCVFRHFL